MNLDVSTDYRVVDGQETVTLDSRTITAETLTLVSRQVAGAWRQAARAEELRALGTEALLPDSAMIWHLPSEELSGARPKLNDVVTDAGGDAWTIRSREFQTGIESWRCLCVPVRV